MITRNEVLRRSSAAGGKIPLLTIDEFFEGNPEEDSIAPNQYGEGRPSLDEIAGLLRRFEADDDVAWIRIQLHEEMFDAQVDHVSAESIAICTRLLREEVDERMNVEALFAEPVFDGMSYELHEFCDVPDVPSGYRVVSLVWD